MHRLIEKIYELQRKGEQFAVCTIVRAKGSAPRRAGAKMIVRSDGTIIGTIGGGDLEKVVIQNALRQMSENCPALFRHDLLHEHSMCCGGTVEIFIEPVMKKNKLYIFGSGHTGQALAKYAANLDFEVYLIDDRKKYLDECAIAGVNKMHLDYRLALPLLPFDENTFICIMTYSHAIDRDILGFCVKKPSAYLGMIGSRRKVEITKKMFLQGGIGSMEELERVDMPMGLDIGAEGPDEIAVSILSKIISVKNRRTAWAKKELQS